MLNVSNKILNYFYKFIILFLFYNNFKVKNLKRKYMSKVKLVRWSIFYLSKELKDFK